MQGYDKLSVCSFKMKNVVGDPMSTASTPHIDWQVYSHREKPTTKRGRLPLPRTLWQVINSRTLSSLKWKPDLNSRTPIYTLAYPWRSVIITQCHGESIQCCFIDPSSYLRICVNNPIDDTFQRVNRHWNTGVILGTKCILQINDDFLVWPESICFYISFCFFSKCRRGGGN